MAATKFYQAEQARHPLLYSVLPKSNYHANLVSYECAKAHRFYQPAIETNRAATVTSLCVGRGTVLYMRREYTLGDLIHELTHCYRFNRGPERDHGHDAAFTLAFEELARWFYDGPWLDEALDAISLP